MLIDFIGSLSPILIPVVIGFCITRRIFFGWIIGALLIYILLLTLFIINSVFSIKIPFSDQFLFLVINIFAFCLIYLITTTKKIPIFFKQKPSGLLIDLPILLIIASILFLILWKSTTPYPLNVNWDIYEHITVANKISNGLISFLPSVISDTFTFDGYSTFFHSLLVLPKLLLNRDLLGSYWWLEYWFYFFSSVASYILVMKLTKRRVLAITAGVLGSLIFESSIVFSNLFLLPQTLAAVLTIFLLSYVIDNTQEDRELREINWSHIKNNLKKTSSVLLIVSAIVILLSHFVVGLFGLMIISLYFILYSYLNRKFLNYMLIASFGLLFISGIFSLSPGFVLTNREEALHFILDYKQLLSLFLSWFGIISLVLFIVGSIYIFLTKNKKEKVVLILAIIGLSVSITPLSYFLKFFVIDRYFIIAMLTIGVWLLIYKLGRILQFIIILIIISTYVVTFYLNQFQYKLPLYYSGFQSQISLGEIEAAKWVRKNYGEDTLIISDPGTQYIIEAISGINSQGGAYMDENTREILIDTYENKNPENAAKKLSLIKDNLKVERGRKKRILFILSGRYFDWQRISNEEKMSVFYNVWQPKAILSKDLPYLNSLSASSKFNTVYYNKELVIMEVNNGK